MQIPVGLMSPTVLRNQRTYGNENQGYWEGDRYIAPKYKPKPPPSLMSPDVAAAVQMIDDSAKQAQQSAAQIPSMWGDGPQGEGFGGGRDSVAPGQSPGMNEAGHVNAPDVNANVSGMMGQPNPAGLPSLPDFKENTTPAAQTTPTNQDLAVSEVDPQGPSGATGKGKGKSDQQAANQAATQAAVANTAAAVAAVDKSIQEKGIEGLVDAVAAAVGATGVNAGVDAETAAGGLGAKSDRQEGLPSVSQAFADHPSVTGTSTGSGGAGNSGVGPGGAGDHQGADNPGQGPGGIGGAGDAPYRRGGRTGGDNDRRKDEVRGKVHEDEFVMNRPMTSLMDRKAPGLLDALDRMQKGLMDRPRKPSRGLMGR